MLYAGIFNEGQYPGVRAVTHKSPEPFTGYPVSQFNTVDLREQKLPFHYKVMRRDKHTNRSDLFDHRKVHQCATERTRAKLLTMLTTYPVTIFVRPIEHYRRKKRMPRH